MDVYQQQLLASIGAFVGTAGLAVGLLGGQQLGAVLALGSKLIVVGATAVADLDALTAEIQRMVDENRGPTAEEYSRVLAAIASHGDRIDQAAAQDPVDE